MEKNKKKCIACCGKGYVIRKQSEKVTKKQKLQAIKLYQKGLSFRAICQKINIKHAASVRHIIKTANNLY